MHHSIITSTITTITVIIIMIMTTTTITSGSRPTDIASHKPQHTDTFLF
jgi:hypothetical protein